MRQPQPPKRLRWLKLPPGVIVLSPRAEARGAKILNSILLCAQDGGASVDAIGGYLAAWACQAEPGATLTLEVVDATEAEAAELAAGDNPPRVIEEGDR